MNQAAHRQGDGLRQKERWRAIPGYEGLYDVSDRGRVRSYRKRGGDRAPMKQPQRVLMEFMSSVGNYRVVNLCDKSGRVRRWGIHQLVMLAFVGPPTDGQTVNHKNGDKTDNRPRNLEYLTRAENNRHAFDAGLKNATGEANGRSILTEAAVKEIRRLWATGEHRQAELARRFGVSSGYVWRVIHRRSWKHV